MKVTNLKPDKRAPGYLVVEVDGARFASLPVESVIELELEQNDELEGDRFERLSYLSDVAAAYRVAVRLLASRPRAVNELLRRLRDRGHNPSAAAEAVGRLEAKGQLDDREFARHFVRVRSAKGHGPGRLLTDLLARGVDRRLAERAIDSVLDAEDIDPAGQARALAIKRAGQLGSIPAKAKRRRLIAYLYRRGFRGHEVIDLVNEIVGEAERGDGDV